MSGAYLAYPYDESDLPVKASAMQAALTAKADLVAGKVPSSQLPSYVDDVLEFANLAAFPATGETGKIYITLDTNATYRWSGSVYVVMNSTDLSAYSLKSTLSASATLIPATLVICAGQSNGQGWATGWSSSTALTNGYGYQFFPTATGGTDGVWFPLHPLKLGRTTSGPHTAFAQTLASNGGGAVLWVDCCSGGSSIVSAAKSTLTGSGTTAISGGTWDLADGANIYLSWCKPNVTAAIATAATNGFSIQKIVVLWMQGEQDAGANALSNGPSYRTKLVQLIDQFVTDFAINCFAIVKTAGNSAPGSFSSYLQAIRTAQDQVATDRASLCTTPVETQDYFTNGWYQDTLHYNVTGQNDAGSTAATRVAAKLSLSLATPNTPAALAKFRELTNAFPFIPGWCRVVFEHQCTGTFNFDIYSGPTTPNAVSWVDGSGTNRAFSGQSMSWSFTGSPSTTTKRACLYISSATGTGLTVVPGSTARLTRMQVLDLGTRISTLNFGSGGTLFAPGFRIEDADFSNIDPSILAAVYLQNTYTNSPRLSLTNQFLAWQPNITALNLNGTKVIGLDLRRLKNCVSFLQSASGLSVSEVNDILVALDTNGLTTGTRTINIAQYLAGQVLAAAPTGAGATAKTSLQGKGWTVTTD